jgi:hypothetical protein
MHKEIALLINDLYNDWIKMINSKKTTALALSFFIVFIGLVTMFRFFGQHLNDYQTYNYNNLYYQNYQSGYNYNDYRLSGAANYVGGYGQRGWSPYLMPSQTYNSLQGYKTTYDSHIYLSDPVAYAYYNNPSLLATRYMDNHQRYVKGMEAQGFDYNKWIITREMLGR